MLLTGSRLINSPVLGLQTGSELARTYRPIIDPHSLQIVAYEVTGPLLNDHPTLLRIADIRELSNIGMIVDSNEEFITTGDVIKIDEIYHLGFQLMGMNVVTDKKKKLGKVMDYTIDTSTFLIQQLTVRRPLLQSLNETELLIHRKQIIEITDSDIIVQSAEDHPEPVLSEAIRTAYVNPFRSPTPQQQPNNSDRSHQS